jgi:hypothetical protein
VALKFPDLLDAAVTDDRFDPQWKPIRYMVNALSDGGGGPETVRAQARDACVAVGVILRAIPGIAGVDLATFLAGTTPSNPAAMDGPGAEAARLWDQWTWYFYAVSLRPDLHSIDHDEAKTMAEEFVQTLNALDEFVWTRLAYWNEPARRRQMTRDGCDRRMPDPETP